MITRIGVPQKRSSTVRRVVSGMLLLVYLSSCTSWKVPPVSPAQVITEDQPSKIQITLNDSSTMELEQPRLVGDTVRGLVKGPPPEGAQEGAQYVISERDVLLLDIATLRVRKIDIGKTLVSAVSVALVVGFLVYEIKALSDTTDGT